MEEFNYRDFCQLNMQSILLRGLIAYLYLALSINLIPFLLLNCTVLTRLGGEPYKTKIADDFENKISSLRPCGILLRESRWSQVSQPQKVMTIYTLRYRALLHFDEVLCLKAGTTHLFSEQLKSTAGPKTPFL